MTNKKRKNSHQQKSSNFYLFILILRTYKFSFVFTCLFMVNFFVNISQNCKLRNQKLDVCIEKFWGSNQETFQGKISFLNIICMHLFIQLKYLFFIKFYKRCNIFLIKNWINCLLLTSWQGNHCCILASLQVILQFKALFAKKNIEICQIIYQLVI